MKYSVDILCCTYSSFLHVLSKMFENVVVSSL